MSKELSKQYDPTELESRWYRHWEESGYFKADPERGGEPFSIVIPPPNITGRLHMGHALNNTLQDVLTRWKRASGFNALWLPGTDHAGIATQNRVEKELRSQGIDRRDLGRGKFLERVWEWRDEYGNLIIDQLRKMGCSCDWSRTRFTLDEGLSRAVRKVFKSLYDEGLIYRGTYLVNWCPKDQTVLSDDEVEYEEVKGHLWHIRYPLEDGSGYIVVATTRPETMLGDTAVAFHPDDARYQHLKGKAVILPLQNQRIPFIQDEIVDLHFGTGMVKVTPAHDPNDYEMGKRHDLPMINILNSNGSINENGGVYAGLDRFAARKKVVADLEALGLLEKVEDHMHQVGHSYRSHCIVEPYLSEQWFVSMKPLAEPAIKAVEDGRIRFVPKSWENTYFHWMRNVRDWPISRQLWWGHQMPVWYCDACGEITVTEEERIERCPKCGSTNIRQEQDVLDTWFSSALWPFSTMGWPDETADLKRYYPTSVLLTAHEIIFFWVARMIMMGLRFMGDVPFRDVYIHAMVFDEKTKKKMSKSLGNIIDPLDIIEKYGTDALRMTVCAYAIKGANLYLSEERFAGYQNFMNKIWNSARFVLMNTEDLPWEDIAQGLDESALQIEDRWIIGAFNQAIEGIEASLRNYEFDQYVHRIYHFVWDEYCDWYLELVKNRLYSKDKENAAEMAESRRNAQIVLVTILEALCRVMQPVAPFITEEIWQAVRDRYASTSRQEACATSASMAFAKSLTAESVMVAPWVNSADFPRADEELEKKMQFLMDAISAVRKIRGEMGVSPAETVDVKMSSENKGELEFLEANDSHVTTLARIGKLEFETTGSENIGFGSTAVAGETTVFVALPEALLEAERKRLAKELERLEQLRERTSKKLASPEFTDKAPPQVVATERERLEKAEQQCNVLRERLKALPE